VARARLTSLGFVVAPTGIHPFGTENCCVFLADGTYLEPLAIGNEQAAIDATAAGNRARCCMLVADGERFEIRVVGEENAAIFGAEGMDTGWRDDEAQQS